MTTTNYSTAVMLFNPNIRAVRVSYETEEQNKNRTLYIFKTLDESIEVGDYVVIGTSSRHNLTVVKVEEVDVEVDIDSATQLAWLVDRVETSAHRKITEDEKSWIAQMKKAQIRKKREDLKDSMMEMYKDEGITDAAIVQMGSLPAIESSAEVTTED